MNVPHKHADTIKAWADGKQIQVRVSPLQGWLDWIPQQKYNGISQFDDIPRWIESYEYRVKPETRVLYGKATDQYVEDGAGFGSCLVTQIAPLQSTNDNLKLTFEDSVLINAEILPLGGVVK